MADHDPEQERQRLSKLYAEMSDGELDAIAADAAELTDAARQALTDEFARRHPEAAVVVNTAARGRDSLELADVVSIRQFMNLPEALLAKGALDSAEIECFLVDDNMARIQWSNLVGGIKPCVKQEEAEAALDMLEQPIPEEFDVDDKYYLLGRNCHYCTYLFHKYSKKNNYCHFGKNSHLYPDMNSTVGRC